MSDSRRTSHVKLRRFVLRCCTSQERHPVDAMPRVVWYLCNSEIQLADVGCDWVVVVPVRID